MSQFPYPFYNEHFLSKYTNITFFHFRHLALIPQFHAFVGSLRNLTHLKLSNCCTDQLLAVIGANCRNLEVLDAEEDSGKTRLKYINFIHFGMISFISCIHVICDTFQK